MRRSGTAIFAQIIMRDPLFQPCNIIPRAANIDELEDLIVYVENALEAIRSDAQGIVDCFTIAVFDNSSFLLPRFSGKVMVVLSPGKPNEVYILNWQDDALRRVRSYVQDGMS